MNVRSRHSLLSFLLVSISFCTEIQSANRFRLSRHHKMTLAVGGALAAFGGYTHLKGRTGSAYCDVGLHAQKRVPSYNHLNSVHNIEFVQLQSMAQIGGSCAWFAVFNALALNECIDKIDENPVWFEALYTLCDHRIGRKSLEGVVEQSYVPRVDTNKKRFKSLLKDNIMSFLGGAERDAIADKLGLANFEQIELRDSGLWVYVGNDEVACATMQEFKKMLLEIQSPVVHLLVTIDYGQEVGHTVLLSYIQRAHKKPLFVYMDSNNVPIGKQAGEIHRDRGILFDTILEIAEYAPFVERFILQLDQIWA